MTETSIDKMSRAFGDDFFEASAAKKNDKPERTAAQRFHDIAGDDIFARPKI